MNEDWVTLDSTVQEFEKYTTDNGICIDELIDEASHTLGF
jgi:hypothetical protein